MSFAGVRHFPTGVRAREYKGQVISLQVTGLRRAEKVPEELQDAFNSMMQRLELALVASFKSFVPGGPEGRLGRQVVAKRLAGGGLVAGNRIIVGTFGSKFARALDRGFTSKAKKGKALRFEIDGETLFRPRVRVAGRHFFAKAIAAAPAIVEAVYDLAFFDIERDLSRF